jgi:membrane protease YdiL (CAAX protease family)
MLALVLTLCFPLLLPVGYGLLFILTGRDPRVLAGPAGFILYLALLAVPFVAVIVSHPELPAKALAWPGTTPLSLAGGTVLGLVLWWLQLALPGRTPNAGERVWTGPPGTVGFALLMLPVAYIVFAEEMVWRAFLIPALGPPAVGLPLSAAAFALHHYHFGPRHVAFSFLTGLALGGLYLLAETLWPAIVSHLMYNALAWRHMRRGQGETAR